MRKWRKPVINTALWVMIILGGYFGYSFAQDRQFAAAEQKREELRGGLGYAQDLSSAFRQVGKIVEPSVVNITVVKKATPRTPLDEDALRKFFDRNGEGEPDLPEGLRPKGLSPEEEEMPPEAIGTGSGVIMEVSGGKGYILTNNHVAGGAEEITVTLADGRKIRNAKVLGADAKSDLAVVQIEAPRLSPAKWGNSDELQKGDWVMAFGSPFNFVGSMTHGIVSALNRQTDILGQYGYENFIQVDAPINPGNSGGPLVSLKGEVIGINTAIASRTGGFQGIGFAIPSNQAKFVYQALKEKGKVVRGWLGVAIKDVTEEPALAKDLGFDRNQGVLVEEVMPDTPATGRLEHGDIVTEINGKPIATVSQLRNMVAAMAPGTEINMRVFRGGKYQPVTVKLGEQPEQMASIRRPAREPALPSNQTMVESLGAKVQSLTSELAQRMGLDVTAGAVVVGIDRNSAAFREGLRPGDVITEVGGKKIATAADLVAAMKGADMKKGARLYVASREGSRYVFVQAEK